MRLNHTYIGYLYLYIRTLNRKLRSVSKDDSPCETYGPTAAVGFGVIIRCMLCILTVTKNDGRAKRMDCQPRVTVRKQG